MKVIFLTLIGYLSFTSAFAYECNGTEPFWNLKLQKNNLVYSNPEMSSSRMALRIQSITDAAGLPSGQVQVIKTKHTTLTLVRGQDCSDGMSDLEYTHHAVYDHNGSILYGCCR